jgi:hypothetical protein
MPPVQNAGGSASRLYTSAGVQALAVLHCYPVQNAAGSKCRGERLKALHQRWCSGFSRPGAFNRWLLMKSTAMAKLLGPILTENRIHQPFIPILMAFHGYV